MNRNPISTRKNLCNHVLLAAANALIAKVLSRYKTVDFIDYYSMTLCRTDEILDRSHYMLPIVTYDGIKMKGSVGIAAVKLLYEKICNTFQFNVNYSVEQGTIAQASNGLRKS